MPADWAYSKLEFWNPDLIHMFLILLEEVAYQEYILPMAMAGIQEEQVETYSAS